MRGFCRECDRLLFPRYGDGEDVCAACRENRREAAQALEKARALEPRDGEPWAPIEGSIGGTSFAPTPPGGPLTPWWLRPVESEPDVPAPGVAGGGESHGEAPTLGRASWPCVVCGAPVVLPEGTRSMALCSRHAPPIHWESHG